MNAVRRIILTVVKMCRSNIKVCLQEAGYETGDWIHAALDMDLRRAVVNTVMNV